MEIKPKMLIEHFYLKGIGSIFIFGAFVGLWDISRHIAEHIYLQHSPLVYILPFGFAVPWWFAGDLFILIGTIGIFFLLVKES